LIGVSSMLFDLWRPMFELCQVASVHSLMDSHYRILVWFSSWKFRSRNPVIRTEGKFSW
jgi:hypothetical protein